MDGGRSEVSQEVSRGLFIPRSGMDPRHSLVAPLPTRSRMTDFLRLAQPANADPTISAGADVIIDAGDWRKRLIPAVILDLASDRRERRVSGIHSGTGTLAGRCRPSRETALTGSSARTESTGVIVNVGDWRRRSIPTVILDLVRERSDRRVSGIHSGTVTSPRRCRTSHATSSANRGCGHRQDIRP